MVFSLSTLKCDHLFYLFVLKAKKLLYNDVNITET